jgi:hypothetical protein
MSEMAERKKPDNQTIPPSTDHSSPCHLVTLSPCHLITAPPTLLRYRPWRGEFQSPHHSLRPILRISLWMIFRRKLFWVLYGFALLIFLMFFFGQYLLAWAEAQTAEATVTIGVVRTDPNQFVGFLRRFLRVDGTPEMYRYFFGWQGYMVMIVLAMTGSIMVGNDFHFGSLPFYLAKPVGRWHYLIGKCLAVGVFVNLMTTLPALILFLQYGFLDTWDYFLRDWVPLGQFHLGGLELEIRYPLVLGIVAYGQVLAVCLSLLLVATASWLRRTVPMIMVWTTLFFFCRQLMTILVERLQYDAHWRLFDLWNDLYLVGSALLGLVPFSFRSERQPPVGEAALVLGGICLVCVMYLNRRIRAVEIVR